MTLNVDEFAGQLRELQLAAVDAMGDAALAGVFALEALVKENIVSNFTMRSGNLLNNWNTRIESRSATQATAVLSTSTVYAAIHEFGGVIRPTHARMLAWTDESGVFHMASSVTIPARPYLRPAMDEGKQDIGEAILGELRAAFSAAAPGAVQ